MDDTRWEISIVCAFERDAEPLLKKKKKKSANFSSFHCPPHCLFPPPLYGFSLSLESIDGSFKQYLARDDGARWRFLLRGDSFSTFFIRKEETSSSEKFLEMDTFRRELRGGEGYGYGWEINYSDSGDL